LLLILAVLFLQKSIAKRQKALGTRLNAEQEKTFFETTVKAKGSHCLIEKESESKILVNLT